MIEGLARHGEGRKSESAMLVDYLDNHQCFRAPHRSLASRSHARAESPPIVFREACGPLLGWTTRANALNPRWRSSINRSMTNRKREFSRAVGASVIS